MVRRYGFYQSAIFLISPLLAFLMSIRDYKTSWAKNVVWAFIAFYGLNFVVVGQYDAVRYIEKLQVMHDADISVFNLMSTIYTGETSRLDFVEPLITFVVSRFTADQRWLMLSFAIVFGYFHSRNLWFLLERMKGNFTAYSLLLFFTFAMVVPMSEMCVFRWMCASQVFLLGVFHFFLGNRRKGIFWICCAPFFHFTFLLGVLVFFLYRAIGERRQLIFVVFVSSFFVSQFNQVLFERAVGFLPGSVETRYRGYLAEDFAEARSRGRTPPVISWHAKYHNPAITTALVGLVVFFHMVIRRFKDEVSYFFYFSILFFSIFNVLDSIPSIHRFTFFSRMMILASCFLFYQYFENRRLLNRVVLFFSPLMLFYAIVRFRLLFEFMGLMTLIGNPLLSLFVKEEVPLIAYIKSLL